ncbi:MAG: hypothetical protein R3D59_18010 [Paracoccaceae bacterium]
MAAPRRRTILYFVLIGFVTGTVGAWFVLQTGAGILLALLAYSFAGALGVVVSAVAFAFAPTSCRARGVAAASRSTPTRCTPAALSASARPARANPVPPVG